MDRKIFFITITFIVLLFISLIAILIARGYQFDFTKKALSPTGILVATSDPDGAEVIVNGKLETATNTTTNLAPDIYDIQIRKDGFSPWEKKVVIKKEEVYKTNAFLFPRVPDLRPITLTGAISPAISPDMTKVVFAVASASGERNGVWLLDMGRGPIQNTISGGADLRIIFRNSPILSLSGAKFLWGSDSKQVLAYFADSSPTIATPTAKLAYLLDTDRLNDNPESAVNQIPTLLSDWQKIQTTTQETQMAKLPPDLKETLATSAANLKFSPDGTKVFYQATSAANLKKYITSYIPGTDPVAEVRNLTAGNDYVYDSKEDRNYQIDACKQKSTNCIWFPSSRHLIAYTDKEINLLEYDGGNQAVVYAGPFAPGIIAAFPNWSKIVILTSLNSPAGIGENLYTVNLR